MPPRHHWYINVEVRVWEARLPHRNRFRPRGFRRKSCFLSCRRPPVEQVEQFRWYRKKKQEKSCPVIDGCYSQRPDAEYERLRSSISIPSIAFHNNWSNRSTGEILEDRVRRSGVTSKTKQTAHDRVSRSVAITHDTNCEVSDGLLESFK